MTGWLRKPMSKSPWRSWAAPGTLETSWSDSRTRGYAERNAFSRSGTTISIPIIG